MEKVLVALFIAGVLAGCGNSYYLKPYGMTEEEATRALKAKKAAEAVAPQVIIIQTSCYPYYVCYPSPYPYAGIPFSFSFGVQYYRYRR